MRINIEGLKNLGIKVEVWEDDIYITLKNPTEVSKDLIALTGLTEGEGYYLRDVIQNLYIYEAIKRTS